MSHKFKAVIQIGNLAFTPEIVIIDDQWRLSIYIAIRCQISDFDLHCAWMKIEPSGESCDLKVVGLGPETTLDPSCLCSQVFSASLGRSKAYSAWAKVGKPSIAMWSEFEGQEIS